MKNKLFLFILCLTGFLLGCNNVKAPSIKFTDLLFDFGEIDQGTRVEHIFTCINTGNDILRIEKVTPTCGCTVTGKYTKEVQPGEKGSIPVVFNSKGFQGNVTKRIRITTNVPELEPITLIIKGNINVTVLVEPQNIWLGETLQDGPPLTGSVTLTNKSETPLKILDTSATDQQTSVRVETLKEGKQYSIELTQSPPFKIQNVREQIRITTNLKEKKIIDILYSYYGTPEIELSPNEIIFMQEDVQKVEFSKIISIINYKKTVLNLINPSIHGEHVSYTIQEFDQGKGFQVTLLFSKDFMFPDDDIYAFKFQLKTDSEILSYSVPFINATDMGEK